ncbi:hypothetical protein ACFYKX_26385 [Cytobacillus sp. FJAT-54145]|uniref:Uncharacterized protein n=1 Tax=Cytobacillus spartinae TaxID=3299023 RepID=A0ABW6KMN7_9BACI
MEKSIEQKLDVVREALEKGADVRLSFFRIKSKGEAKDLINHFSKLTGASIEDNDQIETFSLNVFESPVACSVYYTLSNEEKREKLLNELKVMEEDVDLSGMEEENYA